MTRLLHSIVCYRRKALPIVAAAAVLAVAGARVGVQTASAQTQAANDQDAKRREKNLSAGEVEAKRLLVLMDRDQNGKVSKQEFTAFMEAEFERLDINKDGELDVKELVQTRLTPHVGVRR